MVNCQLHDLGFIGYSDAWAMQKQLFESNVEKKRNGGDTSFHLLVCEHNPVYTMGKKHR
jgi:lipoyl(octanoyl) transferase